MIKTYDEIMESVKQRLGDDSSDEALSFIEDISDTFKSFEGKTPDTEDWKKKYEENDKMWRDKYRDRFFNTEADKEFKATEPKQKEPQPENDEPELATTFDQLFAEKK